MPRLTFSRTFGLTEKETEAILHRLGAPDGIAEALSDVFDEETVHTTIDLLIEKGYEAASQYNAEATSAVLREAIEGSTYAASVSHDDAAFNGALRTLKSAARKLSERLGIEITVPEY